MIRVIVLDSGPLGLLVHRRKSRMVEQCRRWVHDRVAAGIRVVVPEIIDYELRRELLRSGFTSSVTSLDAFYAAQPDRYVPLKTGDLRVAARLWAQARNLGVPTADPKALDVDVILAAQALGLGLPSSDFTVATANVGHLTRFVPADLWTNV